MYLVTEEQEMSAPWRRGCWKWGEEKAGGGGGGKTKEISKKKSYVKVLIPKQIIWTTDKTHIINQKPYCYQRQGGSPAS